MPSDGSPGPEIDAGAADLRPHFRLPQNQVIELSNAGVLHPMGN